LKNFLKIAGFPSCAGTYEAFSRLLTSEGPLNVDKDIKICGDLGSLSNKQQIFQCAQLAKAEKLGSHAKFGGRRQTA
jgi:hypothetical protein